MARSTRPSLPELPPAVLALAALTVLLAIIAMWSIASSWGARSELVRLRGDLEAAESQLESGSGDSASLRQQLQSRAGEIAALEDRIAELESELESVQVDADSAAQSALDAAEASASASEAAASATDLATVTTLISTTPGVSRAVHITDVQDGNVLTGFDLRDMLTEAPTAGDSIQLRLALTDAPAPGDCRHTQSTTLVNAWLEATDHDVLIRQPETPQTDGQGRIVAELLAVVNPTNSLNVTLVVAGEAISDEDALDDDPDLAERLRVAQASAQQSGRGVWGCSESALLGTGDQPTDDPSGSETPAPVPTPTDG